MDPKRIVEEGYDRIGETYERWSAKEVTGSVREHYETRLLDSLPNSAAVLDLGCGSGSLSTSRIAGRFAVTGVDLSSRMIELARSNVPEAEFIKSDMADLSFPAESFDGVCALYSLTHLPPEDLPLVLSSVATWLKAGGVFIASMGSGENPGSVEDEWLAGVPMYFSGHTKEGNKRLLREAGLHVSSAEIKPEQEGEKPVAFLWVVANKPH